MEYSVGLQKERPPHVLFDIRSVERRRADGEVYYDDRVFAKITAIGAKESVDRDAEEWFKYLKQQVGQGRFRRDWFEDLTKYFEDWKKDHREQPANGIPVRACPVFTPAEVANMLKWHVRSVEDMAAGTEELIGRLGMGGRALRQRAEDYLKARLDHGPILDQLNAQRVTIAALEAQVAKLVDANKALMSSRGPEREIVYVGDVPDPEAAREAATRADGRLIDETIDEALAEN